MACGRVLRGAAGGSGGWEGFGDPHPLEATLLVDASGRLEGSDRLLEPVRPPSTLWKPPAWACELPVPAQAAVALGFYALHTLVLSQRCVAFPVQLVPNESGLFQSVGWDTLAGLAVLAAGIALRPWSRNGRGGGSYAAVSPALASEATTRPLGTSSGAGAQQRSSGGAAGTAIFAMPWDAAALHGQRRRCLRVGFALAGLHALSGHASLWLELGLRRLRRWLLLRRRYSGGGGPRLSIAMLRALTVLGSHLAWVLAGSWVLAASFDRFFVPVADAPPPPSPQRAGSATAAGVHRGTSKSSRGNSRGSGGQWLRLSWRSNWVWWVVGGYYVSSLVFSAADLLNQCLLPVAAFDQVGRLKKSP